MGLDPLREAGPQVPDTVSLQEADSCQCWSPNPVLLRATLTLEASLGPRRAVCSFPESRCLTPRRCSRGDFGRQHSAPPTLAPLHRRAGPIPSPGGGSTFVSQQIGRTVTGSGETCRAPTASTDGNLWWRQLPGACECLPGLAPLIIHPVDFSENRSPESEVRIVSITEESALFPKPASPPSRTWNPEPRPGPPLSPPPRPLMLPCSLVPMSSPDDASLKPRRFLTDPWHSGLPKSIFLQVPAEGFAEVSGCVLGQW